MEYVVLNNDDFIKEYYKAFHRLAVEAEDDRNRFRDEVFTVQGAIEEALK